MKKVLFICTGNTCRSCMAEGIFNHAIDKDEELQKHYTASSAGVSASDGDFASSNSIAALREEWGIDISSHRSRNLSRKDIESADLILAMTRSHKEYIIFRYPEARFKTFTLKEYVSTSGQNNSEYNFGLDITDPFGMALKVYKQCAKEIKDAVDKLIIKLKNKGETG